MIELIKVGKYFPTSSGRNYLFRDVSLVLPPNKNVGVIGPNGAGKSTFLRLLSGAELPSEGRIVRSGRISWSLGMSPGLQNSMTGVENTRFAARVYGMRSHEIKVTIEKVRELADVGKYFDMPLLTYSAGMRQKLSFAMSMAMEFEYYLFDEISAGGDVRFRERTQQMIKERLAKANFVVVTHNHSEVVELCHACILIGGGKLTYFDSVQEAIDAYNELFGSEETERKAQLIAAKRAAKAAREAGGEAAGEGRRRTRPLPMAPRRPAAAAGMEAASGQAPDGSATPDEKVAPAAPSREQAAEQRRQAASEKARQRDERKAATIARREAALERKEKARAEKLAAQQARQAAAQSRKAAAEAIAATSGAPDSSATREEKMALAAQSREQAAEQRRQAASEKVRQRDERKAATVARRAAALARKEKARAEKQAAAEERKAAARAAAGPGPSRQHPPGRAAHPPGAMAQLRQSIAALKEQLAAASGETDPAGLKRVRRELAEAKRQMLALVAARRGVGGAPAPAGERPGAATETAIADQQQSDE